MDKKCKVNKSEAEYAGYILRAHGIKPSSDKIKAIFAISEQEKKTELQRFMGMINYFKVYSESVYEESIC